MIIIMFFYLCSEILEKHKHWYLKYYANKPTQKEILFWIIKEIKDSQDLGAITWGSNYMSLLQSNKFQTTVYDLISQKDRTKKSMCTAAKPWVCGTFASITEIKVGLLTVFKDLNEMFKSIHREKWFCFYKLQRSAEQLDQCSCLHVWFIEC